MVAERVSVVSAFRAIYLHIATSYIAGFSALIHLQPSMPIHPKRAMTWGHGWGQERLAPIGTEVARCRS